MLRLGRASPTMAAPSPCVGNPRPAMGSACRRGALQGAGRAPMLEEGEGGFPCTTSRHRASRPCSRPSNLSESSGRRVGGRPAPW